MFLFVFESIGTSELILIGIVALMFLGPRKLPQIAKTIGKTLADFRNTTNEFKATWQREVDFEGEIQAIRDGEVREELPSTFPRDISDSEPAPNAIEPPSIKPAPTEMFTDATPDKAMSSPDSDTEADVETETSEYGSDKRNWL